MEMFARTMLKGTAVNLRMYISMKMFEFVFTVFLYSMF